MGKQKCMVVKKTIILECTLGVVLLKTLNQLPYLEDENDHESAGIGQGKQNTCSVSQRCWCGLCRQNVRGVLWNVLIPPKLSPESLAFILTTSSRSILKCERLDTPPSRTACVPGASQSLQSEQEPEMILSYHYDSLLLPFTALTGLAFSATKLC